MLAPGTAARQPRRAQPGKGAWRQRVTGAAPVTRTDGPERGAAAERDAALQGFLDYVIAANRSQQRGASVIAVSLQELQAALDMGAKRGELARRLAAKADTLGARRFDLGGRLHVLVPPQDEWDLMQVVYETRMLVLQTVGREASELGMDPSAFTQVLHTRRDAQQLRRLAEAAVRGPKGLQAPAGPPGALSQAHIDAVEARAESVGSAAFVREFGRMQAMARIKRETPPELRGREIFISMADLKRQLLPGVQLDASRNLFKELTQRLDRIVLRALAESRLVQGCVSVNMNVANLLTDDFARMAQRLYDRDNSELWVELDIPDIMANLETYRHARTIFRKFRVFTMADAMPADLVPTAASTDLGLDGYKVIYPEADDSGRGRLADAVAAAQAADRPVVLTRVEHDAAVRAGQDLGVPFFQGFYIDALLGGAHTRPGA